MSRVREQTINNKQQTTDNRQQTTAAELREACHKTAVGHVKSFGIQRVSLVGITKAVSYADIYTRDTLALRRLETPFQNPRVSDQVEWLLPLWL